MSLVYHTQTSLLSFREAYRNFNKTNSELQIRNENSNSIGITKPLRVVKLKCIPFHCNMKSRSNSNIRASTSATDVQDGEESCLDWKNLPCPPGFPDDAISFSDAAKARIVAVVGEDGPSPFDGESWLSVMKHMAKRINWIDSEVEMLAFKEESTNENHSSHANLTSALSTADILIGICIRSEASVSRLKRFVHVTPTFLSFDSSKLLESSARMGGLEIGQLSVFERSAANLGFWRRGSQGIKTADMATSAWIRQNADDIWFSILLLVDSYVKKISVFQNLRSQDLSSVQCMVDNCRSQVLDCLLDDKCRSAISCLNSCAPTDQVCSYRCIVSYESPLLESFSLCVLQKHNCLGLDAQVRTQPDVRPMTSFRGERLTHELAEGLLIGWLGEQQYSWRVVAGQNAAYDQFPCQFQIFYRGKARGSMWYDPVFKIRTFDGDEKWRRRHYRVRRAEVPGSFFFSVLDNGVVSKEKWQIVDVCEDFSWALFYYSGAASAAGQTYIGAVLLSKDGKWPNESQNERLEFAFLRCGIKKWEFYGVDNLDCENPPLGLPENTPKQVSLTA